MINLAESVKTVVAVAPATNAGALNGDYVKVRDSSMISILVQMTQGNAAQSTISIQQATTAVGGSEKAITVAIPIWANEDVAATDTLVAQTAAVSFQLSVAVKNKMVVFQLDPATLDMANGFGWIRVIVGASDVGNLASATYILAGHRYKQATPPSAIV